MKYCECYCNDLETLKCIFDITQYSFVYRGQKNPDWALESKIERLQRMSNQTFDIYDQENNIYNVFVKHMHLYDINIDPKNKFNIYSIIQHYGGPTRCLDFSYSPYIALYFALNFQNYFYSDSDPEHVTIWAVNKTLNTYILRERKLISDSTLNDQSRKNEKHDLVANVFESTGAHNKEELYIVDVDPFLYNFRMSNQQSVFLIQNNLKETFMTNLFESLKISERSPLNIANLPLNELQNSGVLKINVSTKLRFKIFNLFSQININESSIYPGLEGFSRFLNEIYFPAYFAPETITYAQGVQVTQISDFPNET